MALRAQATRMAVWGEAADVERFVSTLLQGDVDDGQDELAAAAEAFGLTMEQ